MYHSAPIGICNLLSSLLLLLYLHGNIPKMSIESLLSIEPPYSCPNFSLVASFHKVVPWGKLILGKNLAQTGALRKKVSSIKHHKYIKQ
jgi:hypothetical protein